LFFIIVIVGISYVDVHVVACVVVINVVLLLVLVR